MRLIYDMCNRVTHYRKPNPGQAPTFCMIIDFANSCKLSTLALQIFFPPNATGQICIKLINKLIMNN